MLDNFEGTAFDLLQGCKLIGTPLVHANVLRHLTSEGGEEEPLRMDRSVQFSNVMTGITVHCAHMVEADDEGLHRTQLHAQERILWMGGKVVDQYSEEVTHVLARTVNDVVRRARADEKHVLKFGWVSDCWNKTCMQSSFTIATTHKAHKLELLAGCCIFIDPEIWRDEGSLTRKQFRALGETYGATFSNQLGEGVTHYITNKVDQRYVSALVEGIKTVRAKWLCDAALKKKWLSEGDYTLEAPNQNLLSTPKVFVMKSRPGDAPTSSSRSMPSPAKRLRLDSYGEPIESSVPSTPVATPRQHRTKTPGSSCDFSRSPAMETPVRIEQVSEGAPASADWQSPVPSTLPAPVTPDTPLIRVLETTPPVESRTSSPVQESGSPCAGETSLLAVPTEEEAQASIKRKRSMGSMDDVRMVGCALDESVGLNATIDASEGRSRDIDPKAEKRWQAANELMNMEESLLSNLQIVKSHFHDYFASR